MGCKVAKAYGLIEPEFVFFSKNRRFSTSLQQTNWNDSTAVYVK